MKITDLKTTDLRVPMRRPFGDSRLTTESVDWLFVELETDEGITGYGQIGALHGASTMLHLIHAEFKPVVLGEDPTMIEALREKMRRRTIYYGREGFAVWGFAAIETACWDILAKRAKLPLYKLLGGARREVPAYASGIDAAMTEKQLVSQHAGFVKQGFTAVKMKIGNRPVEEDVKRIRAVRKTVGEEVRLAVDANQYYTVAEALRMGRHLDEMNVFWFEEPIPTHDVAGMAELARELDTPIAAGEMEWSEDPFREWLARRAVDIVQPDLIRNGGVAEVMRIAAMAHAANVPVATHFYIEMSAQLMAAMPNALILEWIPQLNLSEVLEEPPVIRNGVVRLAEKPGNGVKYSGAAKRKFGV
ncbi:MAG TPA: mandelate racemase/muconate lactonizing enzyme family protein [Bryobacterales bacterium]|nr:mandelate racemase/muconate lactonizing enzyme family protein [Bryobacterales bacterium]